MCAFYAILGHSLIQSSRWQECCPHRFDRGTRRQSGDDWSRQRLEVFYQRRSEVSILHRNTRIINSLCGSAAEVSVTIKNQGDEAFKPQEYGSSIIVTRRFTKEGASSYRICAKNGKMVSSNRSELAAICDHMNIQVDNPMNILTQGTPPSLLYRFVHSSWRCFRFCPPVPQCLFTCGQV